MSRTLDKIESLRKILDDAESSIKDAAFYKRILVQAMLTAGGELKVDPKYADEAFNFCGELEFGNSKVCMYSGNGSLFSTK